MTLPTQPLCIGARVSGEFIMLESEERRRHLSVVGQKCLGGAVDRLWICLCVQ
ncbi:MAG: hypothetical protein ACLQIQ_14065 [Beijerinckiaceae bacterium]